MTTPPVQNVLVTTDITHPAVDVIEITASSRGGFSLATAESILDAWAASADVPALRRNGLNIALKRAMEELAHGPTKDLKTLGRGIGAVFTLVTTDLRQADLEYCSGVGIGSAEVSARLHKNPDTGTYEVMVSPATHPKAAEIVQAFEYHKARACATHDVKAWLQQQALPALGAMKSPDARGKAWIEATPKNVKAIQELQVALDDLAGIGSRISLYVTGRSGADSSIVDLITDTLMEEADRVRKEIEPRLADLATVKGLEFQAARALDLRKRLLGIAKAFGIAESDIEREIEDLEYNIAQTLARVEAGAA